VTEARGIPLAVPLTAATTMTSTAVRSGPGASRRWSSGAAPSTGRAWAGTAGQPGFCSG